MWQGLDKRRFPRVACRCVVIIRKGEGEASLSAQTENIGLGGVCVMLDESLPIFSPVEVELSLDDGKSPLMVQGTVVWVVRRQRLKGPTQYDTGVEFASLSAEGKARIEGKIDSLFTK